jgi:murein DD-endopeptidase MepM/ murein hydrolase activator NlpD
VANHRAPRRPVSRSGSRDATSTPVTDPIVNVLERPSGTVGKRKAVRRQATRSPRALRTLTAGAQTRGGHTGSRKSLFPLLPSAPAAVGAAALVIAATGALHVSSAAEDTVVAGGAKLYSPASALTGTSASLSSLELDTRTQAVSRDSMRAALSDAVDEEVLEAVEAQAEERNAALAALRASAEKYAGEIAANAWQLPLAEYRLTARFGYSSSLWANTHTGLDFAAPSGTSVVSVANGVVRSASYDGAYGNKVVVALEDGTEIWYCHLSSYTVAPGQSVTGGQQVGTVGSTGNSTGPHLHLEVRPGAGDAVDPYAALVARGLTP